MKKDGGNISHWQLHKLTYAKEALEALKNRFPSAIYEPDLLIVTGTVINEPTGRWRPGDHFRSSLITKIDRKNNIIETMNTIYHFDPETENKDSIPDLGNGVMDIFY